MTQPNPRTNLGRGWEIIHESGIDEQLANLGIWIQLLPVPQPPTNDITPLEREFFPPNILQELRRRHSEGQRMIDNSGIRQQLQSLGLHIHIIVTG